MVTRRGAEPSARASQISALPSVVAPQASHWPSAESAGSKQPHSLVVSRVGAPPSRGTRYRSRNEATSDSYTSALPSGSQRGFRSICAEASSTRGPPARGASTSRSTWPCGPSSEVTASRWVPRGSASPGNAGFAASPGAASTSPEAATHHTPGVPVASETQASGGRGPGGASGAGALGGGSGAGATSGPGAGCGAEPQPARSGRISCR